MTDGDLFAALDAPPARPKAKKGQKAPPALPPLGAGWYGPPPPVWLFQRPYLEGQHYRIAHTAIVDVSDDDDEGMCSLRLQNAAEPVRVAIGARTVRLRLHWLPSAAKERTILRWRPRALREGPEVRSQEGEAA